MKTSKRIISFVLCVLMVASCFFCTGKLPELKAHADITLGGITQKRVVSNHEATYRAYQKRFFGGEETNWPTDFVIPGLSSTNDYTPQGMTYWAEEELILISAYDATTVTQNEGESDADFKQRKYNTLKNSVIYALDVVTTNMVAVFKIQNADGTKNQSHGGGIAASKYNFYYADSDSKVSYVPLSEMKGKTGDHTIKLKDSVDFANEMKGNGDKAVKTSYCCYDDGVLWTGNFYFYDNDDYKTVFYKDYPSVLMGYKLAGNSSAEEWYYLKNGYNLASITNSSASNTLTVDVQREGGYYGTMKYKKTQIDGAHLEVRGTVDANTNPEFEANPKHPSRVGEVTTGADVGSFDLEEGKKYKISFVSTNRTSDIYMWAPNGGGHCNVSKTNLVQLPDGRWYYEMVFTAGLKPAGSDSAWPATQSTNGNYTGTYTFRIDQDDVRTGSYDFAMTDISVCEYNGSNVNFNINPDYEGVGCAGNPTYVVMTNTTKIQYAMVDKGKIYISRSWKRVDDNEHFTRELAIGEIDLSIPGNATYSINGKNRPVHVINYSDCTHFGGDHGSSNLNQMLWMGEALCVINDYLYMFGESAAWTYNGKSSSKCPEPIDVIWKIDQYAIQGLQRPHEDVTSVEYEKVYSVSELKNSDEYIILHKSPFKDPVTQDNLLYLLDSDGGYDGRKLPKKANSSLIDAKSTGDSRGIVGYEISDYSVKIDPLTGKESIILSAEDDANKSLHWQFDIGTLTEDGSEKTLTVNIKNRDLYFAKHPYLYGGDTLYAMTNQQPGTTQVRGWDNGAFVVICNGFSLWCNDGEDPASIDKYTHFYGNHGKTGFVPNYHGLEEKAGTFHATTNDANTIALSTHNQQLFEIYKRVTDPYASSYETQVYTDLQAKLTADGTYNITLETYATNALQYQRVDERPTDFVFVIDASGSMDTKDTAGYTHQDNWSPLTMKQAAGNDDDIAENSGYAKQWTSQQYYKLPDGKFGQISVAVNEGSDGKYSRYIWLWCTHPETKRCYKISKNGWLVKNDGSTRLTSAEYNANPSAYGYAAASQILSEASNKTNRTDQHNHKDYNGRDKRRAYQVLNFKFYDEYGIQQFSYYDKSDTESQRILGVKQIVEQLSFKIAAEVKKNPALDHRIAVVLTSADGRDSSCAWNNTGVFDTDCKFKQYTGAGTISDYSDVFFSVDEFDKVRAVVNGVRPYGHTFIQHGMQIASNIIDAQAALTGDQKVTYDINGNRSCCVIVISDGAAGGDNDAYKSEANSLEAANGAIGNGAYSLKRNGAYIFSVQIGTKDYAPGLDETTFMKYLSSEYTGSKKMDDPGPLNTKENDYYLQVPIGSAFNITTITNNIFNIVVANSQNAIASLTGGSILREQLTDVFDLTNATISYQTAQSKYDGIGRLYFEDPVDTSGFDTTFNKTSNEITVKGFDYSANNVSEYNSDKGQGKKLIVTIKGVVADRDKILTNASINDEIKTGIYQNSTYMSNNQAVKNFPTYHFSIPEYTYVMDYALPMLDTDINGTLVSVDIAPVKQDVDNYETNLRTDVFGVQFTNGNKGMYYSLNSQDGSAEDNSRAYVLIQRDNGDYDWFRLNLLPASTVYYEEDKTMTVANTATYVDWTQVNSTAGKYQTASTESDIFGNDPLLAGNTDFSLNTHLETTVSSTNQRSETKTFTFKGTGFDLVSACGNKTGIQTVVVKDSKDAIKKVYVVDTFYNDSTYGTIYQAPIVHFEGAYDEYVVETTAAYYSFAGAIQPEKVSTNALGETGIDAYTATAETSVTDEFFAEIGMDELIGQEVELVWMDENSVLNGGEGATETIVSTQSGTTTTTPAPATELINYIDGFRIYNPLEKKYSDAYYPANEKNATYYNLINNLGSGTMTGSSLFAYIEGSAGSYAFSEYSGLKGKGPKNEVYLNSNASNGIAFTLNVTGNVSAKLSMRAASGSPVVKINDKTFTVTNKSEQYFDITEAVKDKSTVTISVINGGPKDLVAIGNLRLNNASVAALASEDLPNVARMMTMAATPVTYDPLKGYTPAPTFVDAPADNPAIDPEGRIPTLEEYIAIHGSGNSDNNDHSGADSFADKLVAIVEKLIDFIKKVIALVVKTVTSLV